MLVTDVLCLSLSISKMSVVVKNQKIMLGILSNVPLKPGWREHHVCCLLAESLKNCLEKKFFCGKRPSLAAARRCHYSSGVTVLSLERHFSSFKVSLDISAGIIRCNDILPSIYHF